MSRVKNRARDMLSCLEDFLYSAHQRVNMHPLALFLWMLVSERLHKVFTEPAWFINLAFLNGRKEAVIISGPFRLFSKPTVSC